MRIDKGSDYMRKSAILLLNTEEGVGFTGELSPVITPLKSALSNMACNIFSTLLGIRKKGWGREFHLLTLILKTTEKT